MAPLFFYKFALTLITPLLLIGLFVRSIKHKQYRQRILERFGFISLQKQGGIVVHAASVGEVIALRPFIEKLLECYPQYTVTVTTFTPTGSAQVKKSFGSRVQHCYLPFDTPYAITSFLRKLKPIVFIIMETEIWPCLIDSCYRRNIKLLLINGRLSVRSFASYQRVKPLVGPTLSKIQWILTQSDSDADRFIKLGAHQDTVRVSGNIKYDLLNPQGIEEQTTQILNALNGRQLWVVGSSHQDEEDLLLNSLKILQKTHPDILCILAPRHPERIKPIELSAQIANFTLVKRSEGVLPTQRDSIWLIDTMGELLLFYSIANICTVAGSFGNTGGHNPLEPALFSCPIIVGPNMSNFKDITQRLDQANAWLMINSDANELADAVAHLLANTEYAQKLGQNAFSVLKQNQGATQTTMATLDGMLLTEQK